MKSKTPKMSSEFGKLWKNYYIPLYLSHKYSASLQNNIYENDILHKIFFFLFSETVSYFCFETECRLRDEASPLSISGAETSCLFFT